MAPNVNAAEGVRCTFINIMTRPRTRRIIRHPKSGGESVTAVSVQSIVMKLLDLRLKPSTAIVASVAGSFTGTGHHEVAMLRSCGTIEVHRIVVLHLRRTHQKKRTKYRKKNHKPS